MRLDENCSDLNYIIPGTSTTTSWTHSTAARANGHFILGARLDSTEYIYADMYADVTTTKTVIDVVHFPERWNIVISDGTMGLYMTVNSDRFLVVHPFSGVDETTALRLYPSLRGTLTVIIDGSDAVTIYFDDVSIWTGTLTAAGYVDTLQFSSNQLLHICDFEDLAYWGTTSTVHDFDAESAANWGTTSTVHEWDMEA